MLPPYDTRETLRRLEAEVAALAPAPSCLLGDTFHDRKSEARLAARRRGAAADAGRAAGALIWVVGNHDADGPQAPAGRGGGRAVDRRPDPAPRAGGRRRSPARSRATCIPAARVDGARAARCGGAASSPTASALILPAFGAYAGGLNVLRPRPSPACSRARRWPPRWAADGCMRSAGSRSRGTTPTAHPGEGRDPDGMAQMRAL